jgi:hypothetical protein
MAKCRLGILTVLFHIALVCAISWDAAPSTTFDVQSLSTQNPNQAPSATPAPSVVINGTNYEPPNLCGYVEYSSGEHTSLSTIFLALRHTQQTHIRAVATIHVYGTRMKV